MYKFFLSSGLSKVRCKFITFIERFINQFAITERTSLRKNIMNRTRSFSMYLLSTNRKIKQIAGRNIVLVDRKLITFKRLTATVERVDLRVVRCGRRR